MTTIIIIYVYFESVDKHTEVAESNKCTENSQRPKYNDLRNLLPFQEKMTFSVLKSVRTAMLFPQFELQRHSRPKEMSKSYLPRCFRMQHRCS